jgi:hypothetical protein
VTAPDNKPTVDFQRAKLIKNVPPKSSTGPRASSVDTPLLDLTPAVEKVTSEAPVYKAGVLVKPLTAFYETIGGLIILGDQVCGQAIIDSAAEAAKSLDELARVNPQVRKVLMKMMTTGAFTKVVVAHLPIIMVVLSHHFPKALTYVGQMMTGSLGKPVTE